ncbi:Cell cycle serine/threonine-protein kinase cdc5/MSD2 [Coemansia sp. RSA 552]|nr:Cell cycle serine/threonine-protein kinase cdc5/MSD2 [Coemansia sp. RSA 552]
MAMAAVASRPAMPRAAQEAEGSGEMFTCADGICVPAVFIDKKGGGQGYRVISLLGRGAFGRCYEVRAVGCSEVPNWACKTIDKTSFKSRKVIERVKYEIKVMRNLPKHANVVDFQHLFEDTTRLYILMELCTSRTLHDLLQRRKRLTEFEARYFIGQLAAGVAALHAARIIHRDIKHSNLLLDGRNRIKIADFGLSTMVDVETDRKKSFLGTPNFLAPELVQRTGAGHSFGVDVWATGVLLFVMLYGCPPFNMHHSGQGQKNHLQQLYVRIVDHAIAFPADPYVTADAKDLINRLCCKHEQSRVAARDINDEPWLSDDIPSYMPHAIFEKPIRSAQEYQALVGTMAKARKPGKAGPVAATRIPLEPIPENEVRGLAETRAVVAGVKTGTAAIRAMRARLQASDAEKENCEVGGQLGKLSLRDTSRQQAPRYALRPRATNTGPALKPEPALKPRSKAMTESSALKPRSTAMTESSALKPGPTMKTKAQPEAKTQAEAVQAQAEFGRVTTLSDAYMPSIQRWGRRLRHFSAQMEAYIGRPTHELEAELAALGPASGASAPCVGPQVESWLVLAKYGLGFRMSDGTAGVLFNDNTSLQQGDGGAYYIYVRPYADRTSLGRYVDADFPPQLEKKRRLVRSFAKRMAAGSRSSAGETGSESSEPSPGSGETARCLLQALATNVGMVFLLTGNVLQFSLRNGARLFLYSGTHVMFGPAQGAAWHFDLRQGPEMLVRSGAVDLEQFLLCLGHAQKVLAIWNPAR